MDSVLVLITAGAVALAFGMAIVVIRLMREERRRSDARVAALVAGAEEHAPRATFDVPRADVRRADLRRADVPRTDVERAEVRRADVQRADLPRVDVQRTEVADLTLRDEPVAASAELFTQPARTSNIGGWMAAAFVIALVAGAGAIVLLWPGETVVATNPEEAAPAVSSAAPLELLSLRHTQHPDSLTITGLVQNPRGGTTLSRVNATAFLFGADGAFLASGRAPLDFSTLAPGDESPFVVTVPVTAAVARYRVGFRDQDGRVIAHVDRRASSTMARNEP